jgi:hypothetical protein
MKTKNSLLLGMIGVLTTVLLAGCMDNSKYPKVSETLYIYNGTDSTIYVEYGFSNRFYSYYRNNTDSLPKTRLSMYRFGDSQINGLWISEKDFNAYVSKIRIYKLNKKDTTFVAQHYYNSKSMWTYEYLNSGNDDYSIRENRNELIILPSMFAK